MLHRRRGRRRTRGVSLAESLVAVAIASTLVAATAGHVVQWRAQAAVELAAAAFEADVHHARSQALVRQDTVRLSFEDAPGGACWVLHSGPRDSCRCTPDGAADCQPGSEPLRVAHWPLSQPVRVQANVRSLAFDPVHGTVSPGGTVRFTGARRPVHQVVGILGRVRSCVPGGGLSGYKAC
jgi:type IV fimbrial biogenesis protein FimT